MRSVSGAVMMQASSIRAKRNCTSEWSCTSHETWITERSIYIYT